MSDHRPKTGDVVMVVGNPGIFRVTIVDDDVHRVDVENATTHKLLSYVPWNALKRAGIHQS